MYSDNDKHCRECLCATCDLRGMDGCLDGEAVCAECDNQSHTNYCPWHPSENEDDFTLGKTS